MGDGVKDDARVVGVGREVSLLTSESVTGHGLGSVKLQVSLVTWASLSLVHRQREKIQLRGVIRLTFGDVR